MSDYAIALNDDQYRTAWEYHLLFIDEEIIFEEFYCPFCHIKLCANLIYTLEDASKSPYFSARWGNHIGDCNGEPLFTAKVKQKKANKHFALQDLNYPQALITRPPLRLTTSIGFIPTTTLRSEDSIKAHREKAGLLGVAIPKSYILRALVQMYNAVIKEVYKKAKTDSWDPKLRASEITKALSAMPVQLEDKTNYQNAFRSPLFINRYPRIYNSTGTVSSTPGLIRISSNVKTKVDNIEVDFYVIIAKSILHSTSPKSHSKLFSKLEEHAASGAEVRWYAYGMPLPNRGAYLLDVDNLDYLYLKESNNYLPKK